MFRRPKKEQTAEPKPIIKCDFCKKNDSIGKVNKVNYCSDNICVSKWWKRKTTLDNNEVKKK